MAGPLTSFADPSARSPQRHAPQFNAKSHFRIKAYALWYRGPVDITDVDSYAANGRHLARANGPANHFPHNSAGGCDFGTGI